MLKLTYLHLVLMGKNMAGTKTPIKQEASQGGRVMRQERQERDIKTPVKPTKWI